jgi:hypothetical protein
VGECASWCRACAENIGNGLNPDGTAPAQDGYREFSEEDLADMMPPLVRRNDRLDAPAQADEETEGDALTLRSFTELHGTPMMVLSERNALRERVKELEQLRRSDKVLKDAWRAKVIGERDAANALLRRVVANTWSEMGTVRADIKKHLEGTS